MPHPSCGRAGPEMTRTSRLLAPLLKPRHRPDRARRALRDLGVEGLEARTLLTITPSLSGSTVSFSGTPGDDLYLQTSTTGVLLWRDSGGIYTSDLGGG